MARLFFVVLSILLANSTAFALTITLNPSAAGSVVDGALAAYPDGVPDQVALSSSNVFYNNFDVARGIFEFDISSFSTAPPSVTLTFNAIEQRGSSGTQDFEIRGYTGNDSVDLNDFNFGTTGTNLGSFSNSSSTSVSLDVTTFIGTLIGVSAGSAGFVVRQTNFETWPATSNTLLHTAQLTAVPEPTTALLLATGLAGLAAAGRRRSTH